jgi:hypothetical protein
LIGPQLHQGLPSADKYDDEKNERKTALRTTAREAKWDLLVLSTALAAVVEFAAVAEGLWDHISRNKTRPFLHCACPRF